MTLLMLSLAALAAGPLLQRATKPDGVLRAMIDGFTLVAMVGIILGSILPESFRLAGWPTLVVALLGVFGPVLFESSARRLARRAHSVAIVLGVAGLIAHGLVDGMGLVAPESESSALGIAVILHRVPAAMTLWWLLRPAQGRGVALGALGIMAATTIVGYAFASSLEGSVSRTGAGVFQALVAGALLHVVLHRARDAEHGAVRHRPVGEGLGALAALAFVWWVLGGAEHQHVHAGPHDEAAAGLGFGSVFLTLARESAPALVVAYFGAGLIQVFLPKASVAWMSRGGSLSQSVRGVVFGLPLPICSCGVVPVYRSLVSQSVPVSASLAFLVATPELGIDAVLMSLPLLGGEMTLVRVAAAAVVAVVVGWVVGRGQPSRSTGAPPAAEESGRPLGERVREALTLGATDLFDSTAPWIVLGLTIAALVQPVLDTAWLQSIPGAVQVPAFALLGMPMYVCASGATPLVAMLIFKGASPGAALAFLLTGPATNVTTFGLLSRLHGRKLAIAFAGTIIAMTVGLGLLVNTFLAAVDVVDIESGAHGHGASLVETVCLGVLGLLVLYSVLRRGPRGFIGQVLAWAGEPHEGHDHGGDAGSSAHGCCGG